MYSHTFPHLSERFFKGTTWPPVEAVLHLVDGDHVFGLLYREMYYRHLYASGKPTLEQRIDSWANYRELFTVVLSKNINMLLPNLWLWDMVDEFVYQFQSFCQYRCAGPPPPPPPCSSAGHRGLDAALCTPPAAPPPPSPPSPYHQLHVHAHAHMPRRSERGGTGDTHGAARTTLLRLSGSRVDATSGVPERVDAGGGSPRGVAWGARPPDVAPTPPVPHQTRQSRNERAAACPGGDYLPPFARWIHPDAHPPLSLNHSPSTKPGRRITPSIPCTPCSTPAPSSRSS